jgi:hypothetical protein
MSRRGRLIGLAIALALLANGGANYAMAGIGACKPVKACEPVKKVPVCKPVKVYEPAKTVPACKPVRPLPPPEVCKPVKACEGVDSHGKHVVLKEHFARFAWRFKRHANGNVIHEDNSLPTTSGTSPTPSPAPKPPTT